MLTVNQYINSHKFIVAPLVILMMWFFNNWSGTAFVYLSMHGTYAYLWLIKQKVYPDRRFSQPVPAWIGVCFIFLPLFAYFLAPFLLLRSGRAASPALAACAIACFTLGIFLHYVSDAQKYYTMLYRKGLIEEGLFSRTRNPNYLGEILIYASFACLAQNVLPFIILGCWVVYFFHNMRKKDASLARHPGFQQYKRRTGMLLPSLRRR